MDVAHAVVIHNAQVARAEGLGHCARHFGFGFLDSRFHFHDLGGHLLLARLGHGPAFLGFGLGNFEIGFGLIGLQLGTDVFAYVNIGDIDGEDFESRTRIQPLFQHRPGNEIGILQHLFVRPRRADGGNYALADARDDRLLPSTANQPVDIGAHRHPAQGLDLDAVFGDRRDQWGVDHFGIDAQLDRFEHIATGQVDRRSPLEAQIDIGLVGRDQR